MTSAHRIPREIHDLREIHDFIAFPGRSLLSLLKGAFSRPSSASGRPLRLLIVFFVAALLLSPGSVSADEADGADEARPEKTENTEKTWRSELPSINAVVLQDLVKRMEAAEDNGINRFYTSDEKAELTPASPLSRELLRGGNAIDYAVGIESLYFIPKEKLDPRLLELSKDQFLLSLYNTLRSVSSLEGIEYYSASREQMRTLFAETWVIRSPKDNTRLPDPTVSSIPRKDTIYIHQKDLTFGENVSEVVYRHEEDALSMSITNETTMRYLLFPLVRKGNMSLQMLIMPVEEGIVFYGLSTIDVLNLKVFYDKMRSSFTNRLIALKDWFLVQVGP